MVHTNKYNNDIYKSTKSAPYIYHIINESILCMLIYCHVCKITHIFSVYEHRSRHLEGHKSPTEIKSVN